MPVLFLFFIIISFFQSFISRTQTTHRTAGEGKGPSFIPLYYFQLPPSNEYSNIYLQLCKRDDYHMFLTAPLVFPRLLLDEIYHLIKLLSDLLMMWFCFCLFTCWFDLIYLLFDNGNRWTRTPIDYHPCITCEPSNQVC